MELLAGLLCALIFILSQPQTVVGADPITEFPLPAGSPSGITAGPNGALWFTWSTVSGYTENAGTCTCPAWVPCTYDPYKICWNRIPVYVNKIGRITTAGAMTEFPLPSPNSAPRSLTVGPDGALWFTDNFGSSIGEIGRITTTGAIFEVPLPTADGIPSSITAGPDGALWITVSNKIGRITPDVVGIAAVSLSESALCTGRTISYQATLTPGPKLTPVDIYLGALLPDGVTFVSLVEVSPGVISIVGGPSPIPFQASVTLTLSVVSLSYTFGGGEAAGTYVAYARLAIAGSNPLLPENELDLAVQSFQFTSGVVLSLSVDAGGSVTRSPAGTYCGPGGYAFAPGTRVTLTAESDFLWFVKDDFLGWGGDCAAVGRRDSRVHGNCTLVMTTNKSVSASFDCPICHTYF